MFKKEMGIIRIAVDYGVNEHQFGELLLPQGTGPFPIIMIIHGGFWRKNFDLTQMHEMAEQLAKQGIATWNIEYNRVGHEEGGWPGTFLDVANAFNYIKVLAQKYPIDLNNILIMGHSAGGHLALWLAGNDLVDPNSEIYLPIDGLNIKGVISLAGVSDLEKMYDIHYWKYKLYEIYDNPTADLLGGSPDEYRERYINASPKHLINTNIPTMLIHGALDVNVPIGLSEQFYEEALAKKANTSLEILKDAEHFEVIVPHTNSWSVITECIERLIGEGYEQS